VLSPELHKYKISYKQFYTKSTGYSSKVILLPPLTTPDFHRRFFISVCCPHHPLLVVNINLLLKCWHVWADDVSIFNLVAGDKWRRVWLPAKKWHMQKAVQLAWKASNCKTVCILEINLAEDHECNSFVHMANEVYSLPVCTNSCVIPYSDNLPWKSVPHELVDERTQAYKYLLVLESSEELHNIPFA
jgi:hypothetical protein